MKVRGKLMALGLALATLTGVAATATPAEARTQVYLGVGVGNPGYYPVGYRDGYRGEYRRDPYWRGGYRDWDRRGWDDRRGWRGDRGWRGGYRERCWTEWRGGRYGRPVRICR